MTINSTVLDLIRIGLDVGSEVTISYREPVTINGKQVDFVTVAKDGLRFYKDTTSDSDLQFAELSLSLDGIMARLSEITSIGRWSIDW